MLNKCHYRDLVKGQQKGTQNFGGKTSQREAALITKAWMVR